MFAATSSSSSSSSSVQLSPSAAVAGMEGAQQSGCVAWSSPEVGDGDRHLLATGTWQGTVHIYAASDEGGEAGVSCTPVQMLREEGGDGGGDDAAPVLSVAWGCGREATCLFAGGCGGGLQTYRLAEPGLVPAGRIPHPDVVQGVRWSTSLGAIATAGWDGCVRVCDLRSPTVAACIRLGRACVALDVAHDVAAVASGRHLHRIDLSTMQVTDVCPPHKVDKQLRCVALLNDASGVAAGAITGRCAVVSYCDSPSYAYNCHRQHACVYPVNAVAVHPSAPVIATAGGDGSVLCWNHAGRFPYPEAPVPTVPRQSFTAAAFSPSGCLFAAVSSYDWSRGMCGAASAPVPKLHVGRVLPFAQRRSLGGGVGEAAWRSSRAGSVGGNEVQL